MIQCKQGRRPCIMGVRQRWTGSSYLVMVLVFGLILISLLDGVQGQGGHQYFVERPTNTSVIRGSTAVLKCTIGNRKGAVQWSKDGFLLGFNHTIPGYDRYSMSSSHADEFNLMIIASQLSDDAIYGCQVMPGQGDDRLMAAASLVVRVPCQAPQILDYNNGSTVEVPHTQQTLSLTCKSRLGRPAATIEWYRDGVKTTSGVTNSIEPSATDKRETSVSTIVIPLSNHNQENGRTYQCRAWNSAVLGPAMRTSVTLSIMFPPSRPVISGYSTGQVVKANNTLALTCTSRGGNPLASVTWYRNTQPVDRSYSSRFNQSINEYTFQVKPSDNKAVYRCEVTNLVTMQPLTAQYNLTVHFPPTSVVMSGATQPVKAGRRVTLTCVTSISNPRATVTWLAKDSLVPASKITETVTESPNGGYITRSEVRVRVNPNDHRTVYSCQATNSEFGQTVSDTHTLSVLYPPNAPEISGYLDGRTIRAGHLERLMCKSVGGNPLAVLKWYKGNKEIRGATYKALGNVATSEIAIVLDADDNGARYKCKASNAATSSPLQAAVTLSVLFPPSQVNITASKTDVKAGDSLDLICGSSSSNPAAEITWMKNGRSLMMGTPLGTVDSDNGGKNTTSRLRLTLTSKDHRAIYSCRATNRVLDQSQTNGLTLDIKFKPEYDPALLPDRVNSTQGEKVVLNLTAYANPAANTYSLMKDGAEFSPPSRFNLNSQGLLTINPIKKEDIGFYMVKAQNSLGHDTFNFSIAVKYPATIIDITNRQNKNEGDTAEFRCQVEANPMIPNIATWSRSDNFDMSRTSTRVEGDITILTVPDLKKEDGGTFKCAADNRIGTVATRTARLIVKFAPMIDKSTEISHSAGEIGSTIQMMCKAEGAPEVTLSWTRNNVAISPGDKYEISSRKSGKIYTSTLKVMNLQVTDYGPYVCTATNSKGSDSHSVTVSGTSKPFAPKELRVVNVTTAAIIVTWKPGFNGGLSQSFRVRYKPIDSIGYKYEDVQPYGTSTYRIAGLSIDTKYEIGVKAFNEKGESLYMAKGIVGKTASLQDVLNGLAPRPDGDISSAEMEEDSDELPVIIILVVCIVAIFILTLNVGLILFFIRRRKKRLENGTSDSTSHTNTFELYGSTHKGDNSFYPPPLSDDARSYGTYDYDKSMDDFSDDYMQNMDDYEQSRVFLPRPQKDYNRPYSPPHKILESPRLGGHKQLYIEDNLSVGRHSPWNDVTMCKSIHPPRYNRDDSPITDAYDYKSNKNVGMNELSDRPLSRPSSRTGSSSVLSPNIVANPNYNGPIPRNRTPSPNDTLPAGSEFRGHLV